jgi:methylenetetrahydrofolate dehydrogenase (NADP+)/methenyltetrahydrofolate cyclohydrolase
MKVLEKQPIVLDGVAIAAEIKAEVKIEADAAKAQGYTPGLAVILVGDVPASQIYVRSKVKTCGELGIYSEMVTPAATATTAELLDLVKSLNSREEIDGILIQLPLPAHVDTNLLLEAVDPAKDVDGFHPVNAGRLLSGAPPEQVLAPCTPAEAQPDSHCWAAGGGAGAQQYRRQASGGDADQCLRDGNSLPLEDARSGCADA